MDIITLDILKEILNHQSDWCVSLYMPTIRAGAQTEQNPIRFRNLLVEAEKQLEAKGLDTSVIEKLLKKPRNLLQGSTFWQHQSDGLVMFFSEEINYLFRVPVSFKELVVVTNSFHIKQLLPLLNSDGLFHVLAVSQNKVRLFEGTRYALDEVELDDAPTSLEQILPDEWPRQNLQFHTGTASGSGDNNAAMYHGHESSNDKKDFIRRWFRKIDKSVSDLLAGTNSPLIIAGVDSLFPLYKSVNSYPFLMDEGISGNPDRMKSTDLHPKAWEIVELEFTKARKAGLLKYQKLAGTGLTTLDTKEALLAARYGRVDVLYVALGVQLWGRFDLETDEIEIHDSHQPGDLDLLDLIATQTLINGGSVFAVSKEEIPKKSNVAAVLRY